MDDNRSTATTKSIVWTIYTSPIYVYYTLYIHCTVYSPVIQCVFYKHFCYINLRFGQVEIVLNFNLLTCQILCSLSASSSKKDNNFLYICTSAYERESNRKVSNFFSSSSSRPRISQCIFRTMSKWLFFLGRKSERFKNSC